LRKLLDEATGKARTAEQRLLPQPEHLREVASGLHNAASSLRNYALLMSYALDDLEGARSPKVIWPDNGDLAARDGGVNPS
jgi:hypothetical protein